MLLGGQNHDLSLCDWRGEIGLRYRQNIATAGKALSCVTGRMTVVDAERHYESSRTRQLEQSGT